MCDYSLHGVASRPAEVGNKLVSTKFLGTLTGGFSAVGSPEVAVCLLPGTEIAFEEDVTTDTAFGLFTSRNLAQRLAIFKQINMHDPHIHHDALQFPDGSVVLLTRLREGQRAKVLQLPAVNRSVKISQETIGVPAASARSMMVGGTVPRVRA